MPEKTSTLIPELRARDLLRPIIGRKWIILLVVLLATGGTYAYYSRQHPVYEASTKIFVGASSSPLATSVLAPTDRTVQNQATLLTSRDVAYSVADRLGRHAEALRLASSITAAPSSGSDFVLITARRPTASDAAVVANAFARAFVRIRSQDQRALVNKALQETRAQLAALPRTQANLAARSDLGATIRQLELSLAVPDGTASQIDPALVPGSPVAPKPTRNALFAFALSLLATIGLAFGLERFDDLLRRIEDVGPLYGLPTIAVLPHSAEIAFRVEDQAALSPTLKEPLRQLRSNIQLAALDRPLKRILVTSAMAGEGKSCVVRNLAIAFRESGLRVAVVDADLRRPTLAQLFGAEPEHGLTDVLTGKQALDDALLTVPVQASALETLAKIESIAAPSTNGAGAARSWNAGVVEVAPRSLGWLGRARAGTRAPATATAPLPLLPEAVAARPARKSEGENPPEVISFLAAGPQPANPQAVLAADQTRLLLDKIAADHDVVLIDSPPLLVVSDAVSLAGQVDGVIVVSRLGLTTRDSARGIAALLARIPGAHPIGVLVNDVSRVDRYVYGYGYGYGYGDPA